MIEKKTHIRLASDQILESWEQVGGWKTWLVATFDLLDEADDEEDDGGDKDGEDDEEE